MVHQGCLQSQWIPRWHQGATYHRYCPRGSEGSTPTLLCKNTCQCPPGTDGPQNQCLPGLTLGMLTFPRHPLCLPAALQSGKTCPKGHLCLHLTCKKFLLFIANILQIKELEKMLEKLQTGQGMNPNWI